ncbi:MAG: NAD(P)H-dependent oxidoreductase subunit E [Firmicutes bacterium HGW-Firmicutes-2]|jgi:NADH-quinone oxidoreductase subunit E/NADP-reducing hydrogenase subunit HndA|uniref:NADH-quinone oxidoreductase subunit NuoE family protein n=1 Tax=Petrocella sp. FN5 TaxID=3032002 RepID=UPI000CC2FA91|nr:NAD(P)H-dependent oxidoreductase subunit E [Petrocella sp. FN5]MDF1615965.1 NAD(P)H-dependent oxidoreductase subunit E [Petrocella sp. FN5]PKM68470.1 MAG: NAD(P)H-dependent oxidoreductase subunit E [Firmicutes bacterium HGW-Firmicutes-2]
MAVNTELTVEKFNELEQYIDSMPSTKGELIRVLHKAQGIFGFLPQEVQKFIAKKLDLSTAKVFGVVSFYSYFTMEPKGENPIAICMGTACYVRGAEKVQDAFIKELGIKVGETTADGKFSLDALRCVGACGLAPVVLVGEKVYGRVTVEDVKKIISNY